MAAPGCLPAGARVYVGGLQGRPALNGTIGEIISFNASRGRYVVGVWQDGTGGDSVQERVLLKPGSLFMLEEAPDSPEDCPICLTALERCVRMRCGHCFHAQCVDDFVSRAEQHQGVRTARCPICRSSFQAPQPIEASAASGRPMELNHKRESRRSRRRKSTRSFPSTSSFPRTTTGLPTMGSRWPNHRRLQAERPCTSRTRTRRLQWQHRMSAQCPHQ